MSRSPDEALADFCPGLPFAVALSGGADSTALLVACAQRWPHQVRAVHVHHGLQQAADGFEQFCRELCERHGGRIDYRRATEAAAAARRRVTSTR